MVHGPPGPVAVVNNRVLKRVEDLERTRNPTIGAAATGLPKHLAQAVLGWTLWKGKGRWVLLRFFTGRLLSGPEILRNKVHTGWFGNFA